MPNYQDMFVYKCVYISLNSFFSSRKSACMSKCSIVFFDYIQLLIYIRISFKNYIGTLRTSRKRWRNNATKDAAFVSSYECRCFSDVMSYWKNETKYSDQHVYIGIRNLSCSACIDYGNAYIWNNADFHDCRTCNPVGYCYRFCFLCS